MSAPDPQTGWFEALGESIPQEQRDAAVQEARKMGLDVPDNAQWVNEVANLVEADCPADAIRTAGNHLDLTGTYRFLAALCTPVDDPEEGGGAPNRTISRLEAEAEIAVNGMKDRLETEHAHKGDGWLVEPDAPGPRWHFWKACDELHSATHHSKNGDDDAVDRCVQDALGHMMMATYLQRNYGYGDQ